MAKQSGLGDNLYLAGYDLSGDVGSVDTISGGPATLDVTTINQSAHSRLGGLRSGEIDFTAFFDSASVAVGGYVGEHGILSTLPRTDVIVSYFRGTALGNPAACMVGKQVNYDPTRAADGGLTLKTQCMANGFGLEWGVQGTAGIRTDTTATNGTGVDLGTVVAAAGFGLQAYLQVFGVTGTSCTVKLQGSSDNGGSDAFADIVGGGFVAATPGGSPQAQRIATASNLTIERYIRVVTTGTFNPASFAVVIVPNVTAPSF